MSNRVELNEKDMEEIVGGAFTYFEDADGYKCHIDGYGTVYASYSAKRTITKLYLDNKGCSVVDLVNLGFSAGVFSNSPL